MNFFKYCCNGYSYAVIVIKYILLYRSIYRYMVFNKLENIKAASLIGSTKLAALIFSSSLKTIY